MKKGILLLAILFSLCFLTACGHVSLDIELAVCGSFSVPGMFCMDLKGGTFSCNIIEEDSEGRILYEYTTESDITGHIESVLVVCQQIDSKYVYFYEDLCYQFLDSDQSATEDLKEKNDWNKPLDYSKMARREIKVSFDLCIINGGALYVKDLRTACGKALNMDSSQIGDVIFIDCDFSGHELYYISPRFSGSTEYFVLCDTSYNVSLFEITDKKVIPSDLAEFKTENGWSYGFE